MLRSRLKVGASSLGRAVLASGAARPRRPTPRSFACQAIALDSDSKGFNATGSAGARLAAARLGDGGSASAAASAWGRAASSRDGALAVALEQSCRSAHMLHWSGQRRCLASSASSGSGSVKKEDGKEEEEEETKTQQGVGRITELVRRYGAVGFGVYGGIYVGTLGLMYGLVTLDVVGAGDALSVLRYTGLDAYLDVSGVNKRASDFALAWILVKFTEPLRLLAAVSVTPMVARALGRAPPKEL